MQSVYNAIAHPARRRILDVLMAQEHPLTINALSDHFEMSRQAVTKHIKILEQAGLLQVEAQGVERRCRAHLQPLKEVFDWLAIYEQFWTEKLDRLGRFLDEHAENS